MHLEGVGQDALRIIANIVLPLTIDLTIGTVESGSRSDFLSLAQTCKSLWEPLTAIAREGKKLSSTLRQRSDLQTRHSLRHRWRPLMYWIGERVLRTASSAGPQTLSPMKEEDSLPTQDSTQHGRGSKRKAQAQ